MIAMIVIVIIVIIIAKLPYSPQTTGIPQGRGDRYHEKEENGKKNKKKDPSNKDY